MIKRKGPKKQLVATFHDKSTGRRHGPILYSKGTSAQLSQTHAQWTANAKEAGPSFPHIEARISETNAGTTVGFHKVSQEDWNQIFKNKRKRPSK